MKIIIFWDEFTHISEQHTASILMVEELYKSNQSVFYLFG
jgi:hypothetical protein